MTNSRKAVKGQVFNQTCLNLRLQAKQIHEFPPSLLLLPCSSLTFSVQRMGSTAGVVDSVLWVQEDGIKNGFTSTKGPLRTYLHLPKARQLHLTESEVIQTREEHYPLASFLIQVFLLPTQTIQRNVILSFFELR